MPTLPALHIDPKTTALVLIDLQQGIVAFPVTPHTGPQVVSNAARLANRFRELGGAVVLVHVFFSPDRKDAVSTQVDSQFQMGSLPPNWAEIMPELGPREGDIVIHKRQWGAFYGTDLDLQLRRRGITTIVLGGIATNMGVESTARSAHEHAYQLIMVEDAMASLIPDGHVFAIKNVFPRLGLVRSTDEVLQALP